MATREEILAGIKDGSDKGSAVASVIEQHSKRLEISVDMNGYVGDFTVKYPSLMDKIKIGTIRSKFVGGLPVSALDIVTDNLSYMSATLMVVAVKSPKWFDLDVLDDYEVLDYVFSRYTEWINSFRNRDKQVTNEGTSEQPAD